MLVPDDYLPIYLMHDLGFMCETDLRSDLATTGDATSSIKFVSPSLNSRVIINYDPAENDP